MLVFASFSYVGSDGKYLGCADHIFSVTTVQFFGVGTRLLIGNSWGYDWCCAVQKFYLQKMSPKYLIIFWGHEIPYVYYLFTYMKNFHLTYFSKIHGKWDAVCGI